jgi:hypothetical protein
MLGILRTLSLFVLVLALIVPIFAQEVTPEVVDAAPVEDAAPVVAIAPVADAVPATDGVQVNLITVIIGLLTAFSAGGIMGIAGLAIFVDRINKNTSTVTALELLASSWPPETRDLLLGISRGLESIGKLGAEVTDGVPVAAKIVPNPLE